MNVRELIKQCENQLQSDESRRESMIITAFVLGIDSTKLRLSYNLPVSSEDTKRCFDIVKRRNSGEPLYYIIGECEFFGLPFEVGRDVLIPRQDTELLVETALDMIKSRPSPRVLDLCSGSGCVAIAIAKSRIDAKVDAVELYDDAFGYLKRNISKNMADNVTPIQADALNFRGDYDLVVSNPPYIAESERQTLSLDVQNEPQTALFAEDNGLIFYKNIAKNFLEKTDVAVEIGYLQGKSVAEIFEKYGGKVSVIKDLCGNDRVITSIL